MNELINLANEGFAYSLACDYYHDVRVNVFTSNDEYVLWFEGKVEAEAFAKLVPDRMIDCELIEIDGKEVFFAAP